MPTCGNAALAIPRISRNQRPTAAFGGAELHMAEQAEADRQGRSRWSGTVFADQRGLWDLNHENCHQF